MSVLKTQVFILQTAELGLAQRMGADATIATVMCDTGMKYLKTYSSELVNH